MKIEQPHPPSSGCLALQIELKKRMLEFDALKKAGKIYGEFDDATWQYRGSKIAFISKKQPNQETTEIPLEGDAALLAKCYTIAKISKNPTAELIYGKLYGFKCIHSSIGNDLDDWQRLNCHTLKKIVSRLSNNNSPTTAYQRACAIQDVLKYLSSINHKTNNTHHYLLPKRISFKHGLANPHKILIDRTSPESHEHSLKKYTSNLHVWLGEAHSRVKSNPMLEPSSGYDLLRLEPLSFAVALGLRVGEICTLPLNAIDRDDYSNSYFARIYTEKTEIPAARPIPSIWGDALNEASNYLLEKCKAARHRAREIENTGFQFVQGTLLSYRTQNPISTNTKSQLMALNLDPSKHFTPDEIVSCFDLSDKELSSEGKYSDAGVPLPKVVASKMAIWLDARFEKWDWANHSTDRCDSRTGQLGHKTLAVARVGRLAGASKATVPKATWFIKDLRDLLISISKTGSFINDEGISHHKKIELIEKWKALKGKMLSNTGGAQCLAIDIDIFCEILSTRYSKFLEAHYKENINPIHNNNCIEAKIGTGKFADLKLSQHLIVVWEHEFTGMNSKGILPRPISRSDFYNYLCINAQKKTIFERLDIRDEHGKIFSMSPHHIRHWVTTAIIRSGPSEMMVDLWMGRTPGQSRHYDHRTSSERAEAARSRYTSNVVPDDYLGRKIIFMREAGSSPEEIEALISSKLRVMHFVPWGACSRELYTSPCNKGLMCLRGFGTPYACESFHIDPQDNQAKESIISLRSKYYTMLKTIEPIMDNIKDIITSELNDSETLDQHIKFILDIIRGCDQALAAYERSPHDIRLQQVTNNTEPDER